MQDSDEEEGEDEEEDSDDEDDEDEMNGEVIGGNFNEEVRKYAVKHNSLFLARNTLNSPASTYSWDPSTAHLNGKHSKSGHIESGFKMVLNSLVPTVLNKTSVFK